MPTQRMRQARGCASVTIMPVVLAPLPNIPCHVVTPRRTECSSLTCHIASPVGPPSRYEITPLTVQPEGYSPRRMAGCLPSTLSSTNPLKPLPKPVWSRHDHMYMISRVIFCYLYLQRLTMWPYTSHLQVHRWSVVLRIPGELLTLSPESGSLLHVRGLVSFFTAKTEARS